MDELYKQQTKIHTKISNAYENYAKGGPTRVTRGRAESSLEALNYYRERFQENHEKIMELDDLDVTHLYFTTDLAELTEDVYFNVKGDFMEKLRSFPQNPVPAANENALPRANNGQSHLKLPRIDLPTFSGNYADWENFRDTFRALIHRSEDIDNIVKLHQLRAHLSEEALDQIKNLRINADQYTVAWTTLTNYYDSQRRIVGNYLSQMLACKPMKSEAGSELKRISKEMISPMDSLEAMGRDLGTGDLFIAIIVSRFDSSTNKDWQKHLGSEANPPTLEQLRQFISAQIITLESCENSSNANISKPTQNKSRGVSAHQSSITPATPGGRKKCVLCASEHHLSKCEDFKSKDLNFKREQVKKNKLCFNCLSPHMIKDCPSKYRCVTCKGKHHTLLHNESRSSGKNASTDDSIDETRESTPVASCHIKNVSSRRIEVLLATARLYLTGPTGIRLLVRALIDQGSQCSIISDSMCSLLKLNRIKLNTSITGAGDTVVGVAKSSVTFMIQPRFPSAFKLQVEAKVLPKVSSYRPAVGHVHSRLRYFEELQLADPEYSSTDAIDVILGADVHAEIVEGEVRKGEIHEPIATLTLLGWIVSGSVGSSSSARHTPTSFHCAEDAQLFPLLQQFWEVENLTQPQGSTLTADEKACEEYFQRTAERDEQGKYVVRLPFKKSPDSLNQARFASQSASVAMMRSLESKFKRTPGLREAYKEFISEYLKLGHMSPVADENCQGQWFLPHHGVIKATSTTTKLRTVFNGSSKMRSGTSLNDLMYTGPNLLPDLPDLILKWRNYRFFFTADVEKMFRQIWVHPSDRKYQTILWRENDTDKLTAFELNTVTYGLASSPYLASQVLKQLAQDYKEEYPLAATTIDKEVHIDDILSGAHSLVEALKKRDELLRLMHLGGFPLRKWSASDPRILIDLPTNLVAASPFAFHEADFFIPVLGLVWLPRDDVFRFHLEKPEIKKKWIKRSLLSHIAKLYDPLGWLAPTVVYAKIIMQSLWLIKLDWDSELCTDIVKIWIHWLSEVHLLNKVRIPRWNNFSPEVHSIELHGYADASKVAYAAVLYLRIVQSESVVVTLQLAKTKVAPLKTLSIPRLELCAAHLLAKLAHHYLTKVNTSIEFVHLWSDSKDVLFWLQAQPSRWPTFVANRCGEIHRLVPTAPWHHVPGKLNPADIASRGALPSQFIDDPIWINGPEILHQLHPQYPVFTPAKRELAEPQDTKESCSTNLNVKRSIWSLYYRYSKLEKLLRVTTYCLRLVWKLYSRAFLKAGKRQSDNLALKFPFIDAQIILESHAKELSSGEVNNAKLLMVFFHQSLHFDREIQSLNTPVEKEVPTVNCVPSAESTESLGESEIGNLRGKYMKESPKSSVLPTCSPLLKLKPIQRDNLLRVGGRLSQALLDEDVKHPLILHPVDHFTQLIIDYAHRQTLHGGPQMTLITCRQEFWILRGRQVVRACISKCFVCKRYQAVTLKQQMADLPKTRVRLAPAFRRTGVDYAGPFFVRLSKTRGKGTLKGYVVIFICMCTRAVHLEMAEDYTAEGFIGAFQRFTSRRGYCSDLFSDQGTNFVGASVELRRMWQQLGEAEPFKQKLSILGTRWHFNPSAAPHFGGIWEAAVRSAKHHLKRLVGDQIFTFVEYTTLLCRIEACLNSRPLGPLTDDPTDLEPLTPAHLLNLRPIHVVPEPDLTEVKLSSMQRWKCISQLSQQFWKRWPVEYLAAMQSRTKWCNPQRSLQVGDLVLVKNELTIPGHWPLGRVIEVLPSNDSLTRAVRVRTVATTLVRPITKLILPKYDCDL